MTVVRRWPQVLWLTVVWVLLWGTVSVKIVVGGILVAAAVTALFPLPLLPRLPFRPWALLQLGCYLLVDLVVSGVQVAWETLRHGPRAQAGIVAVPLLTDSERITTFVAAATALTPGTVVLQIDRAGGRLYVYTLGLRRPDDAARVRRQMERLQERMVRTVGEER
ncbi:Na+/H+ antiporter subunit E [Pseudonocardia kujensis]|uniref:Na+/H+ antiporter subunit E n=1 Tax=Pseudonocardia kujensis TaxID=1128675 RepID=UPI001E3A8600|nr:Na+/H+ antiporter subunit E [Pseudonocardia kujensis]MCE0763917.1 Na+/H+ antiporter subunit E [Pseudonocardia kujensis]